MALGSVEESNAPPPLPCQVQVQVQIQFQIQAASQIMQIPFPFVLYRSLLALCDVITQQQKKD